VFPEGSGIAEILSSAAFIRLSAELVELPADDTAVRFPRMASMLPLVKLFNCALTVLMPAKKLFPSWLLAPYSASSTPMMPLHRSY
jgi:hypothetical protein